MNDRIRLRAVGWTGSIIRDAVSEAIREKFAVRAQVRDQDLYGAVFCRIPIISLRAYASTGDHGRLFEAGMDKSVCWGIRNARGNMNSPGIIFTSLARGG